jgi:hypothetical protein
MPEKSTVYTVLVLQHQEDADPRNLATWLDAAGIPWQLVDVSEDTLPPVLPRRALVVLGSKESVYDNSVQRLAADIAFVT